MAAAKAMSQRSSSVTVAGMDLPGLFCWNRAHLCCIQAHQLSIAVVIGEPNAGGGKTGGGGEGKCLLRTKAIKGARDRDHKADCSSWAAIFSLLYSSLHMQKERARAATGAWSMGSIGDGVFFVFVFFGIKFY